MVVLAKYIYQYKNGKDDNDSDKGNDDDDDVTCGWRFVAAPRMRDECVALSRGVRRCRRPLP